MALECVLVDLVGLELDLTLLEAANPNPCTNDEILELHCMIQFWQGSGQTLPLGSALFQGGVLGCTDQIPTA